MFFTPALVSGVLRMKLGQFVVWNFFAGAVFVLSVGPAAYGAGKVASGHHDLISVGMLVGGLAVGALCVVLGVRHHRRHRARGSVAVDQAEPEPPSDTRRPVRVHRAVAGGLGFSLQSWAGRPAGALVMPSAEQRERHRRLRREMKCMKRQPLKRGATAKLATSTPTAADNTFMRRCRGLYPQARAQDHGDAEHGLLVSIKAAPHSGAAGAAHAGPGHRCPARSARLSAAWLSRVRPVRLGAIARPVRRPGVVASAPIVRCMTSPGSGCGRGLGFPEGDAWGDNHFRGMRQASSVLTMSVCPGPARGVEVQDND